MFPFCHDGILGETCHGGILGETFCALVGLNSMFPFCHDGTLWGNMSWWDTGGNIPCTGRTE